MSARVLTDGQCPDPARTSISFTTLVTPGTLRAISVASSRTAGSKVSALM